MRRFRRERRALSEIVGALMLILIVVGAAVALAAFVANYQKQVQAEEALEHQRSLEALRVLSVVPEGPTYGPVSGTEDIAYLNFTVSSLDVNSITITSLRINQRGVENYEAQVIDPSTGLLTNETVAAGGALILDGYDVVNIVLNDVGTPTTTSGYAFYSTYQLLTTDYIEVELYTALSNDFTQTFVPPTAIAVVTSFPEYTGSGYVTEPELDGEDSFQPGNGTLVSWQWAVTFSGSCSDPTSYSGEEVVIEPTCTGETYTFTLSVQNSYGLVGVSTTTYADPS